MPRKRSAGLPRRKQILDFIATSDQPAGKREIARAFGLSGHDKIVLKALLKDMADEGLIDASPGRAFHKSGGVPKVTVLRVVEVEDSGKVWAVPEQWHAETPPPKLRVIERGRRGALGHRRPHPRADRGEGAGHRRPSDEEARQERRAGAGRGPQGGRAILAVAGRQARAARVRDLAI